MSDSKTKPKNPKYSVSDEVHKAAHAATVAKEERSKARFKLEMAGCEFEDAVKILDFGCDPNQALEMVKQGKTTDKIIDALKKNDGKMEFPPP
ncbi:hypothetical protein SAMN05421690_10884 [Nitrosomonas sp. Nm51]|uniref:hypothetical protein n=1 Tax=Nitrosomonas sp. Nm51 TaxID=133720 RepID=UPI0008D654C0|nr:hypothetical protein [Nitrosomonas sp. Nm51]SER81799.1 hypothetical protein SAMN05421690_10884 [Nitrosomonas sp. Nm51]